MSTSRLHKPVLSTKARRKKTLDNAEGNKKQMSRARCSTSRLYEIITALKNDPHHDVKRAALKKAGFVSLLSLNDCSVPQHVQKWFFHHFDWTTSKLVLPNGTTLTVTREDVSRVYGIPLGGCTILEEQYPKPIVKQFIKDLGIGSNRFSFIHLNDLCASIKTGCADIQKYVRVFILIFIGSMVRAKANYGVYVSDYPIALRDTNTIAHYNWCGHVYDCLLEAFWHRSAYFTSDVHLLQCIALDKFVEANTRLVSPTCAIWTTTRVKKVIADLQFPAINTQESDLVTDEFTSDDEPLLQRKQRLLRKSREAKIEMLNELTEKKDEYLALIHSTNVKLDDTLKQISTLVAELATTVHLPKKKRTSHHAGEPNKPAKLAIVDAKNKAVIEESNEEEENAIVKEVTDQVEAPIIGVKEFGSSSKTNGGDMPTFDLGIHTTQVSTPAVVHVVAPADADIGDKVDEFEMMVAPSSTDEAAVDDDQNGLYPENAAAVDDDQTGLSPENPIIQPSTVSPRSKRKVKPAAALRSPYAESITEAKVEEEDEEMSKYIWSFKKKKDVIVVDNGYCKLDIQFLHKLHGRGWLSTNYLDAFVNMLNFEHLDAIPIPGGTSERRPTKIWFQPSIIWQIKPTRPHKTTTIEDFLTSHPQLNHLTIILDDVKMFFFPCVHLQHWRLFVVNMEQRRLQYLDTISNTGYDVVKPQATHALKLVDEHFRKIGKDLDVTSFEVTKENVPQQPDFYNCGVMVCKLMQLWNGHEQPSWMLNWKKKHVLESFRKQLCACVVLYDGNTMADEWREALALSKVTKNLRKGQTAQRKRKR